MLKYIKNMQILILKVYAKKHLKNLMYKQGKKTMKAKQFYTFFVILLNYSSDNANLPWLYLIITGIQKTRFEFDKTILTYVYDFTMSAVRQNTL